MILLYGATGYTGRLVARTLAAAGDLPLVLAGRRGDALREVAGPLGLDVRIGGLDDLDLEGASAILNCAGPFSQTAEPLITRCLDARVHYLDLAGEVAEHQIAAGHDRAAREAGIMLMPGAGYGIVASDCLAEYVAGRVNEVRDVEIALKTVGGVSRGSAEVVLGGLRSTGVWRREGGLAERRPGSDSRKIDFGDGDGPTRVVTNPWRADIMASVPRAENFEAFMALPAPLRMLMRVPHGGLLRTVAKRLPEGPDDAALAKGRSAVWARATGFDGTQATATLKGPDAYILTALSSGLCLRRVLAGETPPGFTTPAGAWGADLVLEIDGVNRVDARQTTLDRSNQSSPVTT